MKGVQVQWNTITRSRREIIDGDDNFDLLQRIVAININNGHSAWKKIWPMNELPNER